MLQALKIQQLLYTQRLQTGYTVFLFSNLYVMIVNSVILRIFIFLTLIYICSWQKDYKKAAVHL